MKLGSKAALVGAVATSVVQTVVTSEAGFGVEGIFQSLVQIGGPTALGILAANTIVPFDGKPDSLKFDVLSKRSAIAGMTAAGVLVLSGAIPMEVDMGLISLMAFVGAGSAVADILIADWNQIFPQ
jgi:hypothetical protein